MLKRGDKLKLRNWTNGEFVTVLNNMTGNEVFFEGVDHKGRIVSYPRSLPWAYFSASEKCLLFLEQLDKFAELTDKRLTSVTVEQSLFEELCLSLREKMTFIEHPFRKSLLLKYNGVYITPKYKIEE